ncbi:hypothetical protein DDV98_21815 [Streptomyces sp. IB2014 011-12]|nr:hypothetical protein DDV98_21815 [Streptomyces sp. IB2014 011-12]
MKLVVQSLKSCASLTVTVVVAGSGAPGRGLLSQMYQSSWSRGRVTSLCWAAAVRRAGDRSWRLKSVRACS